MNLMWPCVYNVGYSRFSGQNWPKTGGEQAHDQHRCPGACEDMLGTQRILRVVMYGNIITLWVGQGLNRVGKRGVRLHQVMVVLD